MKLKPLQLFLWLTASAVAHAANWPQFRGPGGSGISETRGVPLHWSDTEGLAWKTELPGPGSSSPVVFGDKIFLTCYTGVSAGGGGRLEDLNRHVLCFERGSGRLLWNSPVPADLPEQSGIREDHGYASSTPAVDAERVYVFFGKSGVFAFDHGGRKLWNTKVGERVHGWGSAASLVLHGDLVLVNASVESESLVALDRRTGAELWRAPGIRESWHTPLVVPAAGDGAEVVIACVQEVKAFDAGTGAPRWTCQTGIGWRWTPRSTHASPAASRAFGKRSSILS